MSFPNGINISVTVNELTTILSIPAPTPFKILASSSGPPGPAGQIGPNGAAGAYAIVTEDSDIPVGQLFTLVDSATPTTQTLPPISSVILPGKITTLYNIVNLNEPGEITLVGSGSDQIQYGSDITIQFEKETVTLLPTTEYGWLVI